MARGRMIDRRISKSDKLADLKNDSHRLLYFMILPHLDIKGRYSADPKEIKEDCIPRLKFSAKRIIEALIDLHNVDLLTLYAVNKKPYLEYTRYEDFQTLRKNREGKPRVGYSGTRISGVREFCRTTPALSLSLSLSLSKFKEVKKEVIIDFDFEKRKFLNIKIEDKAGWLNAYPACDINQELAKMREWLLANPEKKKKNYRRFIVNWLSKTQDQGGSKKSKQSYYLSKRDRDEKELEEILKKYPKKEKKDV